MKKLKVRPVFPKPKLANGFVTVANKLQMPKIHPDDLPSNTEEQILYTEQDMKDAFNAGGNYLLGSYKEFKQLHKPFNEWFNENKKK
jgi:hypothetical protein